MHPLVEAVRARGSDARDIRDAAHEACHALEAGAVRWDRESVHIALCRRHERPSDLVASEVLARSVERIVCEGIGIQYDREHWMVMAAMETIKGGIQGLSLDDWRKAIERGVRSPRAHAMADRVLELATEVV